MAEHRAPTPHEADTAAPAPSREVAPATLPPTIMKDALAEPAVIGHLVRRLRDAGIDARAVLRADVALATGDAEAVLTPRGGGAWAVAVARSSTLADAALGAWVEDAVELVDARDALSGFTAQLSDSYDTIDLLYSIGRSMRAPDAPTPFIASVVERLHAIMHFGWVAARFFDDPRVPRTLRGSVHARGTLPVERSAFAAAVDDAAGHLRDDVRRWAILPAHTVLSTPCAPQVLLQPVVCEGRLVGALAAGNKGGSDPLISSYDLQLVEASAGHVSAFVENVALYQAQQDLFLGTIQAMTAAIDAKDRYTRGHSERVAYLASAIARAAGVDEERALRVHIAGLVHDVGKIGVPESVLTKRGRLTDEEFAAIKLHPSVGHTILRGIPLLADVTPAVLHHHERIDGRGYPHGLAGDAIPLYARIIAVADTFDAMSSDRSYRPAMPRDRVLAEMSRSAGSQLDASLVERFLTLDLGEYDALVQRHALDQSAAPTLPVANVASAGTPSTSGGAAAA